MMISPSKAEFPFIRSSVILRERWEGKKNSPQDKTEREKDRESDIAGSLGK